MLSPMRTVHRLELEFSGLNANKYTPYPCDHPFGPSLISRSRHRQQFATNLLDGIIEPENVTKLTIPASDMWQRNITIIIRPTLLPNEAKIPKSKKRT
jgi:hypothetical protein